MANLSPGMIAGKFAEGDLGLDARSQAGKRGVGFSFPGWIGALKCRNTLKLVPAAR
jgi:hypothetical protein